ncbi:MAG: AtpZ/AtpI family protein [Candidatus Magasanikbacteria bacterium]|nr:AtpZ/AtpI family protein [Candidatus Magasanikbacteria bacterium]MCA9390725.1 AtpZ/AtpI family protein [Candidatus Magasanikbacteria bacterium]USN52289.1 MAG: AtpZ/AtpI family protein [Candidatus Nomurabacteria bacterium]HPF95169.1 AtpZ/AtpI family protein [bacterium]
MKIFTWRQRVWVILTNLVMIGVFAGIGYWLDVKFDKKPLFLILGVLTSFPLGQWILIKILKSEHTNGR